MTDRAKGKADAARRAQLIDLVNKAVDGKADELLAGGKDGSIYDALLDEVKNGRVEDAQEELDRLMTAGKDKGSIKSKITESVKEEYLAGSDRDREKRPQMGRIVSRLADVAVVTSDNPRWEQPEKIIEDILPGLTGTGRSWRRSCWPSRTQRESPCTRKRTLRSG